MLRIDVRESGRTHLDVILSGRLTAGACAQVVDTAEQGLRARRRVHLNVSAVTGADRAGVAALLLLVSHGVRLAGCPAFLTLWLRAEHLSRIRDGA
jgi:ABC-type transporter Mla MlaB component